jgi:hypothetical protein
MPQEIKIQPNLLSLLYTFARHPCGQVLILPVASGNNKKIVVPKRKVKNIGEDYV